ncbi:alpha/Beta hydrolase fold protein [Artemisia annua]|uniref:Alpha/Beta hydrolase fold protein n=1 Tax=Artemisia annua TaxID=35608 RepID=A0A2U1Q6L7_ARTAN|nr:alpha/Beta hydrolase fold protein [Artemisia annua]
MNHSQNMFNSEVELSKFLSSSIGPIQEVYDVLLKEEKIEWGLYTSSSGIKVLAFMTLPLLSGDHDLEVVNKAIGFISTGAKDSLFSVNKEAIELFNGFNDRLEEIEKEHIFTPLIITGWGLGGMLAILSALRLQRAVDVEESNGIKGTKRPMCITFGAPLVGGEDFQQAIAKRPQWKSGFLNVVVKKDDGARCFATKEGYKPFGTFLFCTESGHCTALEDEKAIMAVLDTMASPDAKSLNLQDYNEVLSSIRRKVLVRGGASDLSEGNMSLLKAGIALQLKKVGVSDTILIDEMEKLAKMIKRKKNAYEPSKKLNDSKISLTIMEWYMKTRRLKGGYYDSYKNRHSKEDISSQQDIIKHHRSMKQYWKKFVEEKNLMPQKEGANLRKRWLYSGNNYRRIVEPLEIGEYYKNGHRNYIDNRDNHYKLLEGWLKDDMKDQDAGRGKKNKPAILNEDSCFWAYVEEALISLKDLRNAGASNNVADIENQLHWFEAYVKSAIEDYSVSQDIFIRGTSFMKWLNEYKAYKGASYALEFDEYVKSKGYIMYPC